MRGGATDKVAFWRACRCGRPRGVREGSVCGLGAGRPFYRTADPHVALDLPPRSPLFHRSSAPVRPPARRRAGGRRARSSRVRLFWCELAKGTARAHREEPAPHGGRGTSGSSPPPRPAVPTLGDRARTPPDPTAGRGDAPPLCDLRTQRGQRPTGHRPCPSGRKGPVCARTQWDINHVAPCSLHVRPLSGENSLSRSIGTT